jgi:glycosyltransferase involved in cell wall biosynthesis
VTSTGVPREIVYVIASMITGGTQTHLLQLFRFLDRSRYRPHLFCLRDGGDLVGVARELDVPVRSFAMRGTLRDVRDTRGLARMVSAMRAIGPAVAHSYLLRGNFYASIAARLSGAGAVVTSKRGLHEPVGVSERLAVRVSNRLSDRILGNSPAVLDFTEAVEGVDRHRMVMIPSGVDTDRFRPAKDAAGLGEGPVIGAVTTFKPKKGLAMLLETVAKVRETFPRVRLAVAGEERMDGEAARLASSLGIIDSITLLGRRRDMPKVLSTFDVFILPSESEGMSNALLEAMAMELPSVATAVGGNTTVIEDGVSGVLVESGDSRSMADSVVAILQDASLAARLGEAGRRRVVDVYSAASMTGQMEELYDGLLEGAAR